MPIGSKTTSSGSLTSTEVILPTSGPSNSIQQKFMLRRANPSSYCASDPRRGTFWDRAKVVKKGPQCCHSASWHVQYFSRRLIEMSLQFLLTLLQSMTLSPSLAQGTLMMWRGREVIVLDPWQIICDEMRRREKRQEEKRWDKKRHDEKRQDGLRLSETNKTRQNELRLDNREEKTKWENIRWD